MKYKSILLAVVFWSVSIFLIFLGTFGMRDFGIVISAILLFIGVFVNPFFSNMLNKRFFFETKTSMKTIAVVIAALILILVKLDIIIVPADIAKETTTKNIATKNAEQSSNLTVINE